MPYTRAFNHGVNLSNISSEELPTLPMTFAEWLASLADETLADLGIERPIDSTAIYPRVALGDYFQAQAVRLIKTLGAAGVNVDLNTRAEVSDIVPQNSGGFEVIANGKSEYADAVIIATGHAWDADADHQHFSSPWPLSKLLPEPEKYHRFPIGLLGASLSAADVVNVLARRHGKLEQINDEYIYHLDPAAVGFKIIMHSADGLLSHLQFEQVEPRRELYRHCSADDLRKLCDGNGIMRLGDYFRVICRPILVNALRDDGMTAEAARLDVANATFRDFAEMMKARHFSADPFGQMKRDLKEARQKIDSGRPVRWKEVLDDLMYTLNFHARMLPGEDHLELRTEIIPFVMNVMAALPLESAAILTAVHEAGCLNLISGKAEVDHDFDEPCVRVEVTADDGVKTCHDYRMFVDCSGQAPVDPANFPFRSLRDSKLVKIADAPVLNRKSIQHTADGKIHTDPDGSIRVILGGAAISDRYELLSASGEPCGRLFDIAVPHAAGLRPYCYGLQASDEAAGIVIRAICHSAGEHLISQ